MDKKRVAIVGGGIVGTALAYYLTDYSDVQVTLFEKDQIASGTTAKSAGTVCLFDDSVSHEFWPVRLFGFRTYTELEREEKGSAGFANVGTIVVATNQQVASFVKQGIALAIASGYHAEWIEDPARLKQILPDMNVDGVLGAGWTADDGYFDAPMAANTLAHKARDKGAKLHTYTKVEKVTLAGGRVTGLDTSAGHFDCDVVVNAAGPWARFAGRMVDLELPLWHTKAEAFFLIPPRKKLPYRFPVVKYPTFYARPDHDNIFICKAHLTMNLDDPMHAGVWDPDALQPRGGTDPYFLDFIFCELEKYMPSFLNVNVAFSWLGYRAEPPDFLPILGESGVPGYLLAVGFGGNGVIEGPMAGHDLARYIATGQTSWMMDRLPYTRFKT